MHHPPSQRKLSPQTDYLPKRAKPLQLIATTMADAHRGLEYSAPLRPVRFIKDLINIKIFGYSEAHLRNLRQLGECATEAAMPYQTQESSEMIIPALFEIDEKNREPLTSLAQLDMAFLISENVPKGILYTQWRNLFKKLKHIRQNEINRCEDANGSSSFFLGHCCQWLNQTQSQGVTHDLPQRIQQFIDFLNTVREKRIYAGVSQVDQTIQAVIKKCKTELTRGLQSVNGALECQCVAQILAETASTLQAVFPAVINASIYFSANSQLAEKDSFSFFDQEWQTPETKQFLNSTFGRHVTAICQPAYQIFWNQAVSPELISAQPNSPDAYPNDRQKLEQIKPQLSGLHPVLKGSPGTQVIATQMRAAIARLFDEANKLAYLYQLTQILQVTAGNMGNIGLFSWFAEAMDGYLIRCEGLFTAIPDCINVLTQQGQYIADLECPDSDTAYKIWLQYNFKVAKQLFKTIQESLTSAQKATHQLTLNRKKMQDFQTIPQQYHIALQTIKPLLAQISPSLQLPNWSIDHSSADTSLSDKRCMSDTLLLNETQALPLDQARLPMQKPHFISRCWQWLKGFITRLLGRWRKKDTVTPTTTPLPSAPPYEARCTIQEDHERPPPSYEETIAQDTVPTNTAQPEQANEDTQTIEDCKTPVQALIRQVITTLARHKTFIQQKAFLLDLKQQLSKIDAAQQEVEVIHLLGLFIQSAARNEIFYEVCKTQLNHPSCEILYPLLKQYFPQNNAIIDSLPKTYLNSSRCHETLFYSLKPPNPNAFQPRRLAQIAEH